MTLVTRLPYPPDLYDEGLCAVPDCWNRRVNFESICQGHWNDRDGKYAELMVLGRCIADQCDEQRAWPDGFCDDHWSQVCAEWWRVEYREPLRQIATTHEGVYLGPVFELMSRDVPFEWAMVHAGSQTDD